ncbi:MAG: MerR family transcriptional regulator [Anaerolineae bacterium]|jgi:DNA-binding transcriptional MerR regulator|nr:MerR family transcriptional regulator [Chloroflexota bacterium]
MQISEVSERFDLSTDTLRYYEKIGLIPPVPRGENGLRDYREEDCRWVEFARCMRSAGLPIEALRQYVALFRQGDGTIEARLAILRDQREQLAQRIAEQQAVLDRLDLKIARYDDILLPREQELAAQ